MRYYFVLIFLLIVNYAFSQDDITRGISSKNFMYLSTHQPDLAFLRDLNDTKIVSIRTSNKFFNKSYLISKNGDALSSGFMSTSNFLPNDNLIVVSGQNTSQRDSFNPYGAYDMTSMIILSTFNTFISRIKIKRR